MCVCVTRALCIVVYTIMMTQWSPQHIRPEACKTNATQQTVGLYWDRTRSA